MVRNMIQIKNEQLKQHVTETLGAIEELETNAKLQGFAKK